jgi:1-acyl-sn-glycerol-3-phosphate acyltransferase
MTRRFWQTERRAPGRPALSLILWWTGVRNLVWAFFKIVYRIRLSGLENVPATGPVIFISNHQTHFDPCLVGLVATDRPFRAMARLSLFENPVLAWIMRGIGAIELERGKGDAGAMKAALAELEAGRTVMLFPEGTRTRDGAIGPFQRGVTLLIKKSGATVVPVAIEGAFDVWPIGRKLPLLCGRISVRAGQTIDAEALMKDGPDAACQRLWDTVNAMRLGLRAQLRRASGGRYPKAGPGDAPEFLET